LDTSEQALSIIQQNVEEARFKAADDVLYAIDYTSLEC
jgi:enolase